MQGVSSSQFPSSQFLESAGIPRLKDLVLKMVKAAEQFNLDQSQLDILLLKIVVISLKYVDREKLYESLFPQQAPDWKLIKDMLANSNPLGDAESWLQLLTLVDWSQTIKDTDRMHVESKCAPLANTKTHLRANGIDTQDWNTACKVLMLQMVLGLQSMNAIDMYVTRQFRTEIGKSYGAGGGGGVAGLMGGGGVATGRDVVIRFLAGVAGEMFPADVYMETFKFVIERAKVNGVPLQQNMTLILAQKQERQETLRQRALQTVAHLRPRLRDKLKASYMNSESEKDRADSRLGTCDSYSGFCREHGLSAILSDKIKKQLYFMAAQTAWDWRAYVERIARGLEEKIKRRPVQNPDRTVLLSVIQDMQMGGRPPFEKMSKFKARCFQSFPVVYVQRLTLSEVLRLYVTVYQNGNVWADLWKEQTGIMTPQITKDCESFVKENEFAAGEVMVFLE